MRHAWNAPGYPPLKRRLEACTTRLEGLQAALSWYVMNCGDAISMNKVCENPIQSATDMLKHMAVHNASRAFAPVVEHLTQPEPEAAPFSELEDSPAPRLSESVSAYSEACAPQ
jgi:hypothetical protein